MGAGRRQGQAAGRVPHRSSRRAVRPQDPDRPDRLRRGRDAGHPRDRRSASPRRGAPAGPPRLGRRGARPAPGPRTAGAQPDRRRRGPASRRQNGESRITADAVLASPDALPIGDILRAITPVEAELLRLLLLVPDQQVRVIDRARTRPAAEHARTRAVPRDRRSSALPTTRASARRSIVAARSLPLDRRNGLARPRVVRKTGPDARTLDPRKLATRSRACCSISRIDQLRERSEYNESAQAEAERAGDTDPIERLLLETSPDQRSAPVARPAPEDTRCLPGPAWPARLNHPGGNPCPPIRSISNSWRPCCHGRAAPRPISKKPRWPACARRPRRHGRRRR